MIKQFFSHCVVFLFSVSLLLSGCGKAVETPADTPDPEVELSLAREIFSELESSNDVLEPMLDEIYHVWGWSITGDGSKNCTLPLLAKEVDRAVNELKRGYAYISNKSTWSDLSAGERQKLINSAEKDFSALLKNGFDKYSACVNTICGVYLENGSLDEAKAHLDSAQVLLRELKDQFPESRYYPALHAYYVNEAALADYCSSPDGSYEQAKTTVNDFKNAERLSRVEIEALITD